MAARHQSGDLLAAFHARNAIRISWIWNAWAPGGKLVKFGVTIMLWWLSFNAIVPNSVPTPSAEILLTETVTSLASAGVTPIKIAVSPLAMI